MKIIKRSGSEDTFDARKITAAVTKANYEVPTKERLSKEQIESITADVENICLDMNRALSVEEIQDLVEEQIMDRRAFAVARNISHIVTIVHCFVRQILRTSRY